MSGTGRRRLAPLALLLAGLVFAAPAAADVLISNIGKSNNDHVRFLSWNSAQGFATGAHSDGYTLESVEVVAIARLSSDVRVRGRSGTPGGSTIATLTNPWSLAAGTLTFSAPTGTTLAASTTYYVVLDNTIHGGVGTTSHTTEDSGGAPGWSLENDRQRSPGTDTWTSHQHPLRIRVNGVAKDLTAPTFDSATVNGTSLVITFNEAMNTAGNPPSSVFRVTATPSGGSARTIDGTTADPVTIDGDEVTVTLASAVAAGETVTVAYRGIALGAGKKVRDLADNNLADFSGETVTNDTVSDTTAPTFDSATVNGTTLEITFTEDLDTASKPIGSRFGVVATPPGGTARNLFGTAAQVSIAGKVVTVTLTQAVAHGESVTARYAVGTDTNPLRDLADNNLADFSGETVTNNTAAPDTTAPTVVGGTVELIRDWKWA